MTSRDTGRAAYRREQDRLMAERQQKHALIASERPVQPVAVPEVTTDSTQTDSEVQA